MPKKLFLILAGIVILIVIAFGSTIKEFSPIFFQFLFNKDIELKKTNDSVSILLLGIGGGQHEGPNLSDTIIFANVNLKRNTIALISIPRDLWMPDLQRKINTAYAVGEGKKTGGGLILAKASVEKLLNQKIDYVAVVNFNAFIQAVDLIGGITVDVENTLDDYEYPLEGKENDSCGHTEEEIIALATASSQLEAFPCRYSHLHFDKGLQNMKGKEALAFVRSRHAEGDEGTDFARSRRQEKIISAFKEKLISAETLFNPLKLFSLYATLIKNINTNISKEEIDDFAKLAQKVKDAKIKSAVLDYGDEEKNRAGLLMHPPVSAIYENQWVLIPRAGNGNYSEIQQYVECVITKGDCPIE